MGLKALVFRSRLVILPAFRVPLGLCPAYSATQSFLSEREQLAWADAYLSYSRGKQYMLRAFQPSMPATGRARCPCKHSRCAAAVWTFCPQPPQRPPHSSLEKDHHAVAPAWLTVPCITFLPHPSLFLTKLHQPKRLTGTYKYPTLHISAEPNLEERLSLHWDHLCNYSYGSTFSFLPNAKRYF